MNSENLYQEKLTENLSKKRIDAAMTAREKAKSQWGKTYWDTVIAALLKKVDKLN
jgi:hypothetical protein